MYRTAYYAQMKALAADKRSVHGVVSASLGLQKVREIYKAEGVRIDMWDLRPRIRAVYMSEDNDPSVLVNRKLPRVPRLFAMVHELKHHYCDRERIEQGKLQCGAYNANEALEIAAEIFAAEFIFPEVEFLELAEQVGLLPGGCAKEQVVELKRACQAPVSYASLVKRLEWFGFALKDAFKGVQFQKLEEDLYGLPIYKQPWFKARRGRRRASC